MNRNVLQRLSRFVAERPGLVISIISLFLILSALSASTVKFGSMSYEDYMPIGDKVWTNYQLYQKDFGVSESGVFIFIKGDNVVNKEVYEYMLTLGKELRNVNGVSSVVSPASIILNVYGKIPENEITLEELTKKFASNLVVSKGMAIMTIQISETNREKLNDIAEQIERVIRFTPKPIGIVAQATGSPMLSVQIKNAVKKDIRITTSMSTFLMILFLFLTFSGVVRKKIMAFMPLVISVLSVIVVDGIMPVLGLKMTSELSGMMPILIGLAIEYATQVQNRYEEERYEGKDRDEAVILSITRTGLAVVMAMLTTVIGFLSMIAPLVPFLAWFGILMSIGLIIAYILSMTFLPAVLKVTDRDVKAERKEREFGILERALMAVSRITTGKPKAILALALIIILFGAYANTQIKLETDTKKYIPQNLPAMVRFKELEKVVGGQYVFVVVLNCDELNAQTLKKADSLAKYILNREDLVYSYDSLSAVIKKFYGRLPDNDAELSYVISKIPKDVLKRYYSEGLLAIYFKTNADTHEKRVDLWRHLKEDISFFGWHGGYYITGQSVVMAELGQVMINSQFIMTFVAYALIVILLFAVYRSITRAITPLLAITTTIGVLNTFMYIFSLKQTMMSAALNSITLGLGIDFSIHVTERYFEERENFPPIDAVRRTIERTGKAIVTSALAMAGGFGATTISTFPILSNFGLLGFIAIIFSLIGALTVVPAFLIMTERFRKTNFTKFVNNYLNRNKHLA